MDHLLRFAQKFCTEGRIPGARKFGFTWAIPADADRAENLHRILDVTYRFSWGWRRIYNPDTGHDVADLSEYAIPAIQWAVGAGIITGTGTGSTLPPRARLPVPKRRSCSCGSVRNI